MLEKVGSWNFDIFLFDRLTNGECFKSLQVHDTCERACAFTWMCFVHHAGIRLLKNYNGVCV